MRILEKEVLIENKDARITRLDIESPLIAAKARAGQFVVLMAKAEGERIPLTVVGVDKARGSITLIFQELGFTTKLLGTLKEGDELFSLVGPLGHATEIKNYGKVILVGGGVGIAEIYPVAKALKSAGNHVTSILGARSKDLLILESELKAVSDQLHITTDDGSYGRKGFVIDALKRLLLAKTSLRATEGSEAISKQEIASSLASLGTRNDRYDLVYAVGPIPMMKAVSNMTKEFNVKTVVSLNALMVDGTGMCGCCRVTVGGKVKFSCIDGPEFDGHVVDWEELNKRSKIYCKQEGHICKLGLSWKKHP